MRVNDFISALVDSRVPHKLAPNGEVAIHCIRCRDNDYHMHVNTSVYKNGVTGWGYCYRNGCTSPLYWIAKTLKLDIKITEATREVSSFDQFASMIRSGLKGSAPVAEEQNKLKISDFHVVDGSTTFCGKKAKSYLLGRGFTEGQIRNYQLMYSDDGDYLGRIIVPFFEHGKLVYFQARSFMLSPGLKVVNPGRSEALRGKADFLFNFDQALEYSSVVICEGWASAMSAGYNAVAINGKSASELQLRKLAKHWPSFTIMLDAGTQRESITLAHNLLKLNPRADVAIVDLPFGDPNNHDFRSLTDLIGGADLVGIDSIIKRKLELGA